MIIAESYQTTLAYLYSFVDHSLSKTFGHEPVDFQLDRILELMELIGKPHQGYPIIHIAGTKGKGSVTSLCSSAMTEAGYKVGMYTSPHMQDYAERIQINGQPIPHDRLVSLVEDIKPTVAKVPRLTTFEITTALSFLFFIQEKVDVAVIEVGLGGRLDATNIVEPVVTVITSISYDHMFLLGNTLAEIATEKAGIIKSGIPTVVAPQEIEARLAIEKVANLKGSQILQVGWDYLFAPVSHSLDGQVFLVWEASDQAYLNEYIQSAGISEWEPTRLTIPLLGYHQVENAATAYAALQVFRKKSLKLSDADIYNGFLHTQWPGRFEILERQPPVVVDSAHNRDSALKLRHALDDYFPGKPVVMIFGISEDKDLEGMFTELLPRVNVVIATKSFHPRALEPEKIVEMAHRFGNPARTADNTADAMHEALRIAEGEAVILITGSIFMVAEARETWQKKHILEKSK
jgi:dihydrofolate synthase/folylpolyglutamate synthase